MYRIIPVLFVLLLSPAVRAQSSFSVITTFAGTDWLFPGDGRRAADAPLGGAQGLWIAVDAQGNQYIADADNLLVMKAGTDGVLRVIGGNGIAGFSGDGGPATSAAMTTPTGIAVDSKGNVYVAFASRIRRIDTSGLITTVAGIGGAGFSGDGGPASLAQFDFIAAIASDSADNLYICDQNNHRIRKIAPGGTVTTIAGNGRTDAPGDGPALARSVNSPAGIATDGGGNIFFTDQTPATAGSSASGLVRQITPAGQLITVEGPVVRGLDRPATRVPVGIAADTYGNLFVGDASRASVYRINLADGSSSLVAGLGRFGARGFSGDGGAAALAQLSLTLGGLAIDNGNNLLIADNGNGRVRRVSTGGAIATVAGNGNYRFSGDGAPAPATTLYLPYGVAVDGAGFTFITEPVRNRIRRVAANGIVSTFAGTGDSGFSGDGGPGARATLAGPAGLTADNRGNLYVADALNSRIRRLSRDGTIVTIAGTGAFAYERDNVPARQAALNNPQGVAVDGNGNVYVADTDNQRIRRISPEDIITTVAGNGAKGYSGDGGPAASASLNQPTGVAVDSTGALYIADSGNHRIRKLTAGTITTVAGNGRPGFAGDGGAAVNASLSSPTHVALDRNNTLYISDSGNNRVRRVANGNISTVAGITVPGYSGDGGPSDQAALAGPAGLAFDAAGSLLIADQLNHRIRVVLATRPTFVTTPAQLSYAAAPDDPETVTKNVYVLGSVPGLPFSVAANKRWLNVSPANGITPATVQVSVDPSKIGPDISDGAVSIASPLASTGPRQVAVSLLLLPPDPGLKVDSNSVAFSLFAGSAPQTRSVLLFTKSPNPLAFRAAIAGPSARWLSVSPAAGTVDAQGQFSLQIIADAAKLGPGTYTGRIDITDVADGDSLRVIVNATVSAAAQSIFLTQAGLTFTAVAQGGVTAPQSVGVINLGGGNMTWRAVASGVSGAAGWLSVAPDSGSSGPGGSTAPEFVVTADPTGLAPGDYYGQVRVTAADADNSPQVALVILTVLPPGSTPTPIPQPSSLVFVGAAGGDAPGSQTVSISNLTDRTYTFTTGRVTQQGSPWFVHIPSAGSIGAGQTARVVVQPFTGGLAPGVYRGSVTLLYHTGTPRPVNVVLIVTGAGSTPAKQGARTAGECGPTKLIPVFTSLGAEAPVPVGWPQRLVVRVLDDCGRPIADGRVGAQFSGNIPPLSLTSLRDGNWTGSWQSRTDQSSSITVKVQAEVPAEQLRGAAEITSSLQLAGNPPVLLKDAIVNAASLDPLAPLAPGALITISGANLASGTATSPPPLPTQMAGTLVAIGGRAAPLLEVGENRVSAMIPFDVPVNTRTQLIVQRGASAAVPETVTIAPAQPAIFTQDKSGSGQGSIYKAAADGSLTLANPGSPVTAGDTIVVQCTGLGAVDPAIPSGAAAPDPAPKVLAPVSLTIGGVTAEVVGAVLQTGSASTYAVRAKVPDSVTAGDAVPVVLTAGNQSSLPVTIAVR